MTLLKFALAYRERNLSVIPVKPNKTPFIKWEEFQKRIAESDEIRAWFERWPAANIGIVTGKISGNLGVIDIDDERGREAMNEILPESYLTPIADTPGGGEHIWTIQPDGISLANNAKVIPGTDFRGEGGYVVAPPSKGEKGSYRWKQGLSLDDIAIAETPKAYIERVAGRQYSLNNNAFIYRERNNFVTDCLKEGTRNDFLFHIANQLAKSNTPLHEIALVLENIAKNCHPPFPERELKTVIESALKRSETRQRNFAEEIKEWISVTSGYFSVINCYDELQAVTKEQKNTIRQNLFRLAKDGVIQKHLSKNGIYRLIDTYCEEIDFLNCPTESINIKWPFEIERYVRILPKNIVVIAGVSNSGKTALLLNFIEMNMDSHIIYYYSSEMGSLELKERLSKFERPIDSWKFKPSERSSNFQDVIQPDAINIIDFLEIHDEHWKIAGHIKEIYDRLNKGIAIIAIQKKPEALYGTGGASSMEKARLYLTIDNHKLRMGKAKNWATPGINPNGLELEFKTHRGCMFEVVKEWHKTERQQS